MEAVRIKLERNNRHSEFSIVQQKVSTNIKLQMSTFKSIETAINAKFKDLEKFVLTAHVVLSPYCYYSGYSIVSGYDATIESVHDFDDNDLLKDSSISPIKV